MRSSHSLDRVDAAFDGTQLVADAGLLLPATLTLHLGLKQLVERHLDLGRKPGQANRGDKLLTLVLSALAGGDCIDDADALRAGGTERILGFRVKAPPPWARSCGIVTAKTLRRRLFGLVGRLTRSARRITLHLPARWPWAAEFTAALARFRAIPLLA